MKEAVKRELMGSDGVPVGFTVSHLPARKGFVMLAELLKIFAPALGILVDAAGGLEAKASVAALVKQKTQGPVFERVALVFVERLNVAVELVLWRLVERRCRGRPAGAAM